MHWRGLSFYIFSPFFVMGRRVYADDAEKDYAMAGIERLFIVSLVVK